MQIYSVMQSNEQHSLIVTFSITNLSDLCATEFAYELFHNFIWILWVCDSLSVVSSLLFIMCMNVAYFSLTCKLLSVMVIVRMKTCYIMVKY